MTTEHALAEIGARISIVAAHTIKIHKAVDALPPRDVMLANQFLYYVESSPVWSDFEYDAYCERHKLEGHGGSDRADSYSPEVQKLAAFLTMYPDIARRLVL